MGSGKFTTKIGKFKVIVTYRYSGLKEVKK